MLFIVQNRSTDVLVSDLRSLGLRGLNLLLNIYFIVYNQLRMLIVAPVSKRLPSAMTD